MADQKLQELIDTLKQQGVQSGEEAGRQIVEAARKQAEQVLAQAKAEAEGLVAQAKAEADKQMKQLQSSLEIAASQFVTNLKRVIETSLLVIPLKEQIAQELSDGEFLKKLMTRFVETYAADTQGKGLELLLAKEAPEELWDYALALMSQRYGQAADKVALKMEAQGIGFGFMARRSDGVVRLDFSDEAFLNLFLQYLSTRFREMFKNVKIGDATV